MIEIRPERPEDIAGVHAVNEAAFPSPDEANLVDALRDARAHVVSLVAIEDDCVVGHILFSPVTIESETSKLDALGLAPMSVLPDHQRKGIGSKLVEAGLAACRKLECPAVVVLGHPNYYPRFGFVPSVEFDITSEYDVPAEVFMVLELSPGALSNHQGLAKYHPAFDAL